MKRAPWFCSSIDLLFELAVHLVCVCIHGLQYLHPCETKHPLITTGEAVGCREKGIWPWRLHKVSNFSRGLDKTNRALAALGCVTVRLWDRAMRVWAAGSIEATTNSRSARLTFTAAFYNSIHALHGSKDRKASTTMMFLFVCDQADTVTCC